ncbi:hypothetical protein OEZ85_002477 [Tetradesmus obliquus]|uniref:Hedgehog protein Hint domain-containing protein n=1 Tax=Tetradesmus obliquus TaxID=3088 RepID=A0ABY8U1S7_TETOB|nr:hypothetical protein OEZ85_002477 [Tetradesmus obliquus]
MLVNVFKGALLLAALLLAASSCAAEPLTVQELTSRLATLNPGTRAAALQALQQHYPALYAQYIASDASTARAAAAAAAPAETPLPPSPRPSPRPCPAGRHWCPNLSRCANSSVIATCGTRCYPCPRPVANGGSRCIDGKCSMVCRRGFQLSAVPGSTNKTCTPIPDPTPCPKTQGLVNGSCSNCTEGHPGDGYSCPTPPCFPGVQWGRPDPTAPTEDGCMPCLLGSNGWKCLNMSCPAGYYPAANGTCRACPAGSASGGNATACEPCAPGSYQPLTGQFYCWPCRSTDSIVEAYVAEKAVLSVDSNSTGMTAPGNGSTSCDTTCPKGQASTNGANCTPCMNVPGFGLNTDGTCVLCGPGTYATSNMTACEKCPAGTSSNQNTNGDNATKWGTQLHWLCASCRPMFTWSSFFGVFSVIPGGAAPEPGAAECTPCTANTTNANSTGFSWRGLACNATCADIPGWGITNITGTLEIPTGGVGCRPCPSNTTSPGDGNTTCTACTTIDSLPVRPGSTQCNNASFTGNCFPGHARVWRQTGSGAALQRAGLEQVEVSAVRVGDVIQVVLEDGSLGTSKVFAMPHYQHTGFVQYFTLTTASRHRLQLSSSHYAYTAPSPASTWPQRTAVEGKAIQPGHVLWVVDRETGSLIQSEVTDVEVIAEVGAFVMWTLEGHAVVEGAVPSSYSSSFGSDEAMHKVAQVAKMVYRIVGEEEARVLHESGAINAVAAALKAAFRTHSSIKDMVGSAVAAAMAPMRSLVQSCGMMISK